MLLCMAFQKSRLTLSNNDVHIWRVFLDQPATCVRQLALELSADEQDRARCFYFEQARTRFIVARGFLRRILSYYLGIEPGQLQFRYGDYGKPALAESSNAGSLRFNLSHSHELALYAVTLGREVGIDIEHMRHIPEVEQLVERFFSAQEIAAFRALHPNERYEAFFKLWTRKEAYLKVTGAGLSLPPHRFVVSLNEPARLLNAAGKPQEAARWSLQDLRSVPGYAAALAVEGARYQLAYYQY